MKWQVHGGPACRSNLLGEWDEEHTSELPCGLSLFLYLLPLNLHPWHFLFHSLHFNDPQGFINLRCWLLTPYMLLVHWIHWNLYLQPILAVKLQTHKVASTGIPVHPQLNSSPSPRNVLSFNIPSFKELYDHPTHLPTWKPESHLDCPPFLPWPVS